MWLGRDGLPKYVSSDNDSIASPLQEKMVDYIQGVVTFLKVEEYRLQKVFGHFFAKVGGPGP